MQNLSSTEIVNLNLNKTDLLKVKEQIFFFWKKKKLFYFFSKHEETICNIQKFFEPCNKKKT